MTRADFGEIVPEDEVEDGVILRDCALVERDGEEVYVRRIPAADRVAWIERKEKSKGGIRLWGDHRDGQRKRFLDFKGVTLMRNTKLEEAPCQSSGSWSSSEGRGYRHDELPLELESVVRSLPIFCSRTRAQGPLRQWARQTSLTSRISSWPRSPFGGSSRSRWRWHATCWLPTTAAWIW